MPGPTVRPTIIVYVSETTSNGTRIENIFTGASCGEDRNVSRISISVFFILLTFNFVIAWLFGVLDNTWISG